MAGGFPPWGPRCGVAAVGAEARLGPGGRSISRQQGVERYLVLVEATLVAWRRRDVPSLTAPRNRTGHGAVFWYWVAVCSVGKP